MLIAQLTTGCVYLAECMTIKLLGFAANVVLRVRQEREEDDGLRLRDHPRRAQGHQDVRPRPAEVLRQVRGARLRHRHGRQDHLL